MKHWPLLLLVGCAPPVPPKSLPVTDADACEREIASVIVRSGNCTEMQLRVDTLLQNNAACKALYEGKTFDVCAKVKKP